MNLANVPIVYDHANRVAVVTGGTKGIGRGIAECLLAGGATVVIAARDQGTGEKTLSEWGAGDRAAFIRTDVTREDDCNNLVDTVVDRYGALDILVNNAGGTGGFKPVAEMSTAEWQHTIDLNLTQTFWCSRRALQTMLPRQWGRIVNVSSLEALEPAGALSNYVAAKRGIHAFTRGLSKEVGSQGITANTICPGLVVTDMVRAQVGPLAEANGITEEQFYGMMRARSPIGRLTTPEEIGAFVGFLCTEVGGSISGQVFSLDGGVAEH